MQIKSTTELTVISIQADKVIANRTNRLKAVSRTLCNQCAVSVIVGLCGCIGDLPH